MRILDRKKIKYEVLTYESTDGKIDGVSVAEKIGRKLEAVYKTLVAQGQSKNIYIFVIPVNEELDLKKAASAAREKNMEMIPVKDLLKWTGYVRGGCSPVGIKKDYKTYIDSSAIVLEKIIVSGGKIGFQIELSPIELTAAVNAELVDLVRTGA
jgi:Cys-tRNA(Pro)/Cys-tRNA(Cys) deacylase